MKKAITALCLGFTLVAVASPAFARAHHPAPASQINSGYGPPSNWSEIEVSHSEGG